MNVEQEVFRFSFRREEAVTGALEASTVLPRLTLPEPISAWGPPGPSPPAPSVPRLFSTASHTQHTRCSRAVCSRHLFFRSISGPRGTSCLFGVRRGMRGLYSVGVECRLTWDGTFVTSHMYCVVWGLFFPSLTLSAITPTSGHYWEAETR